MRVGCEIGISDGIHELAGIIKDQQVKFDHTKEPCSKSIEQIKELDSTIHEIKFSCESNNSSILSSKKKKREKIGFYTTSE